VKKVRPHRTHAQSKRRVCVPLLSMQKNVKKKAEISAGRCRRRRTDNLCNKKGMCGRTARMLIARDKFAFPCYPCRKRVRMHHNASYAFAEYLYLKVCGIKHNYFTSRGNAGRNSALGRTVRSAGLLLERIFRTVHTASTSC